MIALLVMTDGRRHCIERSIPVALENLDGPITTRVIHDDSGDVDYRRWLVHTFPDFQVIGAPWRRGFGGAIRAAWAYLYSYSSEPFVFHLEDDFLVAPTDLEAQVKVLNARPELVQMALLRGPVNAVERRAGGVIEQHPDSYTLDGMLALDLDATFRTHRRYFTTNPSLYRRKLLIEHSWPEGESSEGRFGIELFAFDEELRAAYWGGAGELGCEHIGDVRVGTGY